eukprot:4268781-Amphidinium_carterae.2
MEVSSSSAGAEAWFSRATEHWLSIPCRSPGFQKRPSLHSSVFPARRAPRYSQSPWQEPLRTLQRPGKAMPRKRSPRVL